MDSWAPSMLGRSAIDDQSRYGQGTQSEGRLPLFDTTSDKASYVCDGEGQRMERAPRGGRYPVSFAPRSVAPAPVVARAGTAAAGAADVGSAGGNGTAVFTSWFAKRSSYRKPSTNSRKSP